MRGRRRDDGLFTMFAPAPPAPVRLAADWCQANRQPAFGCYLPDPHGAIAHAYGLMVLTMDRERICAITWFADRSVMAIFGLPRTLPT
jgi:RNA polymerase sigma-70 factor (ECF subfamily)